MAHGGERRRRATRLRDKSAMLRRRTLRHLVFAVDRRRRCDSPGGRPETQPAPRSRDCRKRRRSLPRRHGPSRTRCVGPRVVTGVAAGVAAIDRHSHIARNRRHRRCAATRRIFSPRCIPSRTFVPISPPSGAFAHTPCAASRRARTSSSPDGSPARPFNPRFFSSPRGSQPRADLQLPLRVWLFAWPLAKLAALLPLTQGGIGVREAALVALLAPFGAAGTLVLAAGLVWEGVTVTGGILAGLTAFVASRHNKIETPR